MFVLYTSSRFTTISMKIGFKIRVAWVWLIKLLVFGVLVFEVKMELGIFF